MNVAKLSKEAQAVLISAGTNRQGAKIFVAGVPMSALCELRDAGLIGKDSGLTRKGSIVRERLVSATLDGLF